MGWVQPESLTERSGTAGGIWLTSQAFRGVIGWFPMVLAVAVFLFAFSTMISWSYYGEQALGFPDRGEPRRGMLHLQGDSSASAW